MTPHKKRKTITIEVTPEFYEQFEKTASKRFIHCQGYKSKYILLALTILININQDPHLMAQIHKTILSSYMHHDHYFDRISALILDAIHEYTKNS